MYPKCEIIFGCPIKLLIFFNIGLFFITPVTFISLPISLYNDSGLLSVFFYTVPHVVISLPIIARALVIALPIITVAKFILLFE